MIYDLAIIGGGPAGVAAGVYASRKQLKTIFITEEFGGQSIVSPNIQNWIGIPSISGADLAKALREHLEMYANDIVDIKIGVKAEKIEKTGDTFTVKTNDQESYEAKTIMWTAGAHRRKLTVPGAEEYDQKGLTYCATCDGPLFTGKDVAVIGGGNAGFETAAQLLKYVKSVTLLDHDKEFRADPITVKRVLENENMKAIGGVDIVEVKGNKMVTGVMYKDIETEEVKKLDVEGIFVEIGLVPSTELIKDLVELDKRNHVVTDPKTQRTSLAGIWAAGDATDALYHQNNIAVGDAVKALEDIYNYLHTQ